MTIQADIKKFLPSTYLQTNGKNTPALIKAINDTHEKLEQLVQACIDHLFIQTASGRYLIQLGEQEGFVMPPNSGLDIRSYQVLTPTMVASPKQVRQTIDELIQDFYTAERTRASITSSVAGPYNLSNGDDLIIETESGQFTISLTGGQVSDLSKVAAAEIASVINTLQGPFTAQSVTDRNTTLDSLRITSSTSGAGSKIRVAGGKMQNVLKFPNLVATLAQTGTTWNIAKTFTYTDIVTFTWDGINPNPNVYLAKVGDIVTIRGLVDGATPLSLLNGSYPLVDVGYDYFVIRNIEYASLGDTLIQAADNNIIFTSQAFISLYDRDEYAFTSETKFNTITMTVPAIPPLGRRFLQGSEHLHGLQAQVIDFTRSSMQLQLPLRADVPKGDNHFLLKNNRMQYNFRHPYYETSGVDSSITQPTYTMTGDNGAVFPFTSTTLIGTDPITGTVGSNEFVLAFPYKHGLERGWGFTLSGASATGNITAPDLNTEHEVGLVIDEYRIMFTISNTDGTPKLFTGATFGPVDVSQYSTPQPNGADFVMQFATTPEADAIVIGSTFRFNTTGGTDTVPYLATQLRYRALAAVEVNGSTVAFSAGLGAGPNGTIMTGVSGTRSGPFGGAVSYFFDKISALNQSAVFNELLAVMLDYTPSSNPGYIGSFMYDPSGDKTTVTVSKYVTYMTTALLKGDNIAALLVDSATIPGGSSFPQSGYLVIDYGTDEFEGPIRYLALVTNPGANQILIDPAYRFKKAHNIGAQVQYIHSNQPFTPDLIGTDLPFYLTGTAQGRNTMFALAEELVAAGVFVEHDVLLPDLRYADTEIAPFD